MHLRRDGWRGVVAVLILVVTASCGGTSTPDVADSEGGSPPPASSETSASSTPENPSTETPVTAASGAEPLGAPYGECGEMATMIETNAPIEAVVLGTKLNLCVQVPEGVTRLVFDLSDMTAALNLFVGYPDLSTLEAGGEHFWASERGGRDDETITIEPGPTGFVDPGSYFIEISGGDSADGASFVLVVSMS